MNKKKKGFIILQISLFISITMAVLIIIGSNSHYLITKFWQIVCAIILVISTLSIILGIILLAKHKRRRFFKKLPIILSAIFITCYILGCSGFLFILYGPYHGFKDWLITTAMRTMNHQYYCMWFYSDEVINEVLSNNYIIESGEETDTSLVTPNKDTQPWIDGASTDYERAVLEHNEGDLYKLIQFQVNDNDAYLVVVYDPHRISVGISRLYGEHGQYVSTMAKYYKAPLAINGGGFSDPGHNSTGGIAGGVTIMNGKIISDFGYGGFEGVIGFNNDDILVLRKNKNAQELIDEGVRDAVTMGPFLIVNGKKSEIKGNGGWGYAARTAIGQRKDGIVLMLVVDCNEFRTTGASMKDLADIMERYGAINAANLDGGTSSVLSINYEIVNDPIDSALKHKTRGIPTIFMVK